MINKKFYVLFLSVLAISFSACARYSQEGITGGFTGDSAHPRITVSAKRFFFFGEESSTNDFHGTLSEETNHKLSKLCRHGDLSDVTTEIKKTGFSFWGTETMTVSATCTTKSW